MEFLMEGRWGYRAYDSFVHLDAEMHSTCTLHKGTRIYQFTTLEEEVKTGEYVEIKPGCHIGKHVCIGDGVVIGANSVICPYVTIGNKAVIRPGSVVTKDVPEGQTYAGNPAVRVIIPNVNNKPDEEDTLG
jgi:acetyltransferase-like isoleucine patch superfamily enzyme